MSLDLLSVVAQIIEAVAVVGALIYAGLQIRDARKSSKIESAWQIFRELSEDDTRRSRTYIYKNREKYKQLAEDGSNLKKLTRPQWHHANQVSNAFDRVGFLVYQGLVPLYLLEGYKYLIGRSWIVLEPFIIANRNARREPTYQAYFEKMAMSIFEKYIDREDIHIYG